MQVSWKWLNELVDLSAAKTPHGPAPLDPQRLADILTGLGLEVENTRILSKGFEKVVTAQVIKKDRHPDADRLSLCKVSTGSGEPLQIVCGAQNFKEGDKVCLAQVGADLPNGMKIKAGKIRGVESNGMLCSESELGLAKESEGILVLAPETELGRPLADVLGLDDTIFEVKLTPNRGDCLSHIGIARDLAAYLTAKGELPRARQGEELRLPKVPELKIGGTSIRTGLEAGDLSPQFWGTEIEGVKVGPSPEWLVRRLEAIGSRSINNVVDATNLVLFETGQPTHAYDAERIEGGQLVVRLSRAGEELPLLDGTEIALTGEELVIADSGRPVGLAGVMGGGNSEVQEGTTRVFLECAEFSPVRVRRAAGRFVKHTDASHRFERGVDPNGQRYALARLASLVTQIAGGRIVGTTVAAQPSRDPAKGAPAREIRVAPSYFTRFLGYEVSPAQALQVLEALGCRIREEGGEWVVNPPSYRLDLAIREDLADELVRFTGYDRIPSTLPPLSCAPTFRGEDPFEVSWQRLNRAKNALASLGMSEVLEYSFTSREWLKEFGLEPSVTILNPISEEWECMAPSLVPGLIRAARDNQRRHFGSEPLSLRFFEIRPTFAYSGNLRGEKGIQAVSNLETGVTETWRLAMLISGPRFADGLRTDNPEADFYDLKGAIEEFFGAMATKGWRIQPCKDSGLGALTGPQSDWFHPGQTASVIAGGKTVGHFGRLHPGLAKRLKLKGTIWVAELDWDPIRKLSGAEREFKAWSEFPGIERDFALLVKAGTDADKITQVALQAGKPLAKVVKVFDIYRGSQVAEGMTSIAVRVIFSEETRSLQEAEADEGSQRILAKWKSELGAELRG